MSCVFSYDTYCHVPFTLNQVNNYKPNKC
uniref:Uncharacterized protein n=1 Tax=Anguilla anguilla TaxID=7936 RepID=A0A0E9PA17_ANGAN